MTVNRCVCLDIPFAELQRTAQALGLSFEQLSKLTGCSTGCGLCAPYIRLMLRTGRTDLPVMHPNTIERLLHEVPGRDDPPPPPA